MTPDDKDAVLDLARANLARADLTPDELPADMEAVVARLEVAAIDPAPWPDLRALLKAYQEQRRALEPFAKAAALFDTGDYVNHDACIYRPAAGDEYSLNSGHLLAARAALNQKGDEL
jgi:hypothetical protein